MPRAGRICAEKLPTGNCPLKATTGNRCEEHARAYEARRGSRSDRGYDAGHVAERARVALDVAAGRVRCWRCDEPIAADEEWDLGHADDGRIAGPEHRGRCNRRAAALKGHGKEWSPAATPAPLSADLSLARAESRRRADRALERYTVRQAEREDEE